MSGTYLYESFKVCFNFEFFSYVFPDTRIGTEEGSLVFLIGYHFWTVCEQLFHFISPSQDDVPFLFAGATK